MTLKPESSSCLGRILSVGGRAWGSHAAPGPGPIGALVWLRLDPELSPEEVGHVKCGEEAEGSCPGRCTNLGDVPWLPRLERVPHEEALPKARPRWPQRVVRGQPPPPDTREHAATGHRLPGEPNSDASCQVGNENHALLLSGARWYTKCSCACQGLRSPRAPPWGGAQQAGGPAMGALAPLLTSGGLALTSALRL